MLKHLLWPTPMLCDDELPPVSVLRPAGRSPFVLTADHAGQRLPAALGTLGLSPAELDSHIAWDIGVAGLTECLAQRLDAFAILQTYSRLAIDCNRPPDSKQSIVALSERTVVPGNRDLDPLQAAARRRAIFDPYHQRLATELDSRAARGQPSVLVALHSFTPCFLDVPRPWHVGVLYGRDQRLAQPLLQLLRAEPGLEVGENQPYSVSDAEDFGIPMYGEQRGLLHVLLEVRNDLLADPAGQDLWAERLARLLVAALAEAVVPG